MSLEGSSNFAVLGPWDYVDIFDAPDMDTALALAHLVKHRRLAPGARDAARFPR